MRLGRTDPGPCIVCGAPHCSCGGGGPIAVVQLPARDAGAALGAVASADLFIVSADGSRVPVVAVPLGDGSDGRPFSTATYRGKNRRP